MADTLDPSCIRVKRYGVQDTKRTRPGSGTNSRKSKGKSGKPRASVTLKELVDFGVIQPGRNKISVAYKGINYLANLGKDGVIMYQGEAIVAVFDLLPDRGKLQVCLSRSTAFHCKAATRKQSSIMQGRSLAVQQHSAYTASACRRQTSRGMTAGRAHCMMASL